MVIAFPPHVVALLRGRCLRPKLERLVTAACSAVPMNSRAWVTRARPCFEQGPVLPYTPRGYCSSCPLVGTVLGVPRTPRGSTGRAAFLCLRRRCERISSRELLSGTGRSLHSSRHPSGFMHAVVLRACVHRAQVAVRIEDQGHASAPVGRTPSGAEQVERCDAHERAEIDLSRLRRVAPERCARARPARSRWPPEPEIGDARDPGPAPAPSDVIARERAHPLIPPGARGGGGGPGRPR